MRLPHQVLHGSTLHLWLIDNDPKLMHGFMATNTKYELWSPFPERRQVAIQGSVGTKPRRPRRSHAGTRSYQSAGAWLDSRGRLISHTTQPASNQTQNASIALRAMMPSLPGPDPWFQQPWCSDKIGDETLIGSMPSNPIRAARARRSGPDGRANASENDAGSTAKARARDPSFS